MCAAPGGKTTAIAILMKDEGQVIATDRSHNKVTIFLVRCHHLVFSDVSLVYTNLNVY